MTVDNGLAQGNDPQGDPSSITCPLCSSLIARDGQPGVGFQKHFP